jgi:hypothetical protein
MTQYFTLHQMRSKFAAPYKLYYIFLATTQTYNYYTDEHIWTYTETLLHEQLIVESLKSIYHIKPPTTFTLTVRLIVQVLIDFPSTMTKISIPLFPLSKTFSIQLI